MKKPTLVIMAAGMGSSYGGLKQIDPVDKEGHIIMDFSIYDAVQAGFRKVVFIIKKENEADFRSAIGDRLSNQLEVSYVFQDLHNIPEGYEVPEGRVKPWGTGHAVLSCINEIDGPFVVINADDYYGSHAFKMAYDFLTENEDTADTYRYMMVGYKLENTLTENGHVARGVCVTDEEGHLLKINERTHIEKHDGGTAYTEDDGKTWPYTLLLDERNEVSYPDAKEADNGYIYVTYDWERVTQREILMACFTEDDILCGKLLSPKGQLRTMVNKALGKPDIH